MQLSKLISAAAALFSIFALSGQAGAQTLFSSATNSVSVSSSVTDPKASNDGDTDVDLPNVINLSIDKQITSGAGPYVPGKAGSDTISYTVTIKNEGPVDAEGLGFRDQYNAAGLSGTWECKDNGADCAVGASGSGNIEWNNFTLASGQTLVVTLDVVMDSSFTGNGTGNGFCAAGQMQNRAWFVSSGGKTTYNKTDVNGDNAITDVDKLAYEFVKTGHTDGEDDNKDHACADLTVEADLAASKDDGLTYYTPGESSTYTLRAWNHGPADATTVVLTDTLPAGISNVNSAACILYNAPGGGDDVIAAGDMTVPDDTIDATANFVVNVERFQPFGAGAPAGLPDFSGSSSDQYLECLVTVTWSTDPDAYQ